MSTQRSLRAPRKIADYAIIGDCETAALVHYDGSIEWLCWPRFDSEACLAALLGDPDNGVWKIAPCEEDARRQRRYRSDTLILETMIETATGRARLIDFMPVRGKASDVVRIVLGESGTVRFRSDLCVRFCYGKLRPQWIQLSPTRVVAVMGPHAVRLVSEVPMTCGEGCAAEFSVAAGQHCAFVLTYFRSYRQQPADVDAFAALDETERFWAEWTARCTYEGPWREAVIRSLIVMKALTYRPSGGIAAAATSSLPERRGGSRNWDYRFCWLRDATFTLLSFLHTGYSEEAIAWRDWLVRAVGGEPGEIQPVYGMCGETRLPEWSADWLAGFAKTGPVRFGNIASTQRQFDTYGEVIDALHQSRAHGIAANDSAWQMQMRMLEHLEQVWQQPDHGIWETRGRPQRFTYSQAMIWVAFDRTIMRAEADKRDAPIAHWKQLRDRIHREICQHGFNRGLNSFVRAFESSDLDASLLLLPQIGFLPPDDPRILGTIEAIGHHLAERGFLRRYDTQSSADGMEGNESAFLACSFWYADALIMTGRWEQGKALFERVLSVRNDLGLLAEEYNVSSAELAGNFPQVLSHLALVNTALNLARAAGPAHRRSTMSREPAARREV